MIVLAISVLCYFFANLAQNKFSKQLDGFISPMNYFQALWMGIACIIYVIYQYFSAEFSFSSFTLTIGGISGIINILGGMALLLALSSGPLSLTILIFSMYIIIPPILAVITLGESATICQLISLILIIFVMVLTNYDGSENQEKSRVWWLLCIASSIFTGISSFLIKYHQTILPGLEKSEYAISGYITGILLSIILAFFNKKRELSLYERRYKFSLEYFLYPAIIVAAGQGGAAFCNLYNASRLPAVILYPVSQLSTLMLTVIFSIIVLKEKPTKLTFCSLGCGVVAIILMNF